MIRDIYADENALLPTCGCESDPNNCDYNGNQCVWNREHVWPKSFGIGDGTGAGPDHNDMHHLFASFSGTNSARSNKFMQMVGCVTTPAST